MKIISKYKDFYDYLLSDYDADVIYVRKAKGVEDPKVCKKADSLINEFLGKISNTVPAWGSKDMFFVTSVVFGIYPYVYRIPFIRFGIFDPKTYPITPELFDEMAKADKLEKLIREYIIKREAQKIEKEHNYSTDTLNALKKASLHYERGLKANMPMLLKKAECRDVFRLLNAPVFVRLRVPYDNSAVSIVGFNSPYHDLVNPFKNEAETRYLINISFEQLGLNLIPLFQEDLYNINTPINIENFLSEMKMAPESIPDNKTKIEMHGFDIKTSFRKM